MQVLRRSRLAELLQRSRFELSHAFTRQAELLAELTDVLESQTERIETIEQQLATSSEYTLTLRDARVVNGEVSGTLVVIGPGATGLRVQVVAAERGVLFPGKSEVGVHRMVARGSLLGAVQGVATTVASTPPRKAAVMSER